MKFKSRYFSDHNKFKNYFWHLMMITTLCMFDITVPGSPWFWQTHCDTKDTLNWITLPFVWSCSWDYYFLYDDDMFMSNLLITLLQHLI